MSRKPSIRQRIRDLAGRAVVDEKPADEGSRSVGDSAPEPKDGLPLATLLARSTASPGRTGGSAPGGVPAFTTVPFDEIQEHDIDWLIEGLIPMATTVVLVGDEGIGKGLYWCWLTAKVTNGHDAIDVLLIISEDDPETTVKARLRAAGADMRRVHVMVSDVESMTGVPLIPNDATEVLQAVQRTGAALVIVDPWLSVVPGNLSVKDTQQARQALDPINAMARQSGASFLVVTHTNRLVGGSARNRYGNTVALRQASRLCLMALPDSDDPEVLYVGVEKANITGVGPATKFRKVGEGAAWKIEVCDDQPARTVHELLELSQDDEDHRTTEKWNQTVELAKAHGGLVTRTQLIAMYEESGSNRASADKSIRRWQDMEPPRLRRADRKGQYQVTCVWEGEPPAPPVLPDRRQGGEPG